MRHLPIAILGILVGVLGAWAYDARGQRGAHLTYAGLVGVPIGASGGEVVSRIGYPVAIRPWGGTRMDPLGHAEPWPEGYVWVYASPNRWLLKEGLAVYVLLLDGRVVSLNAKYDDMSIFWRLETSQSENEEGLRRLESELRE